MSSELEKRLLSIDSTPASLIALVYGNPGVGKTVAAHQLADAITAPGKMYLTVDTSEGWVSLLNHPELSRKDRYIRDRYTSFRDLNRLVSAVVSRDGIFANVDTIVFDELSVIADHMLNGIAVRRENDPTEKDKLPEGSTDWRDFNILKNFVRRFFIELSSVSSLNIICTAHERRDKNPDSGVNEIRPDFPASVWTKEVSRLLHLVARATCDIVPKPGAPAKYVRKLQVHPTNVVQAKTRIGGLSAVVTMPTLIERINSWRVSGVTTSTVAEKAEAEAEAEEEEDFQGIEVK